MPKSITSSARLISISVEELSSLSLSLLCKREHSISGRNWNRKFWLEIMRTTQTNNEFFALATKSLSSSETKSGFKHPHRSHWTSCAGALHSLFIITSKRSSAFSFVSSARNSITQASYLVHLQTWEPFVQIFNFRMVNVYLERTSERASHD